MNEPKYDSAMNISCPHCNQMNVVRYCDCAKILTCEKCGAHFEASQMVKDAAPLYEALVHFIDPNAQT